VCTYTGAEWSGARSTIAERSGAPNFLCRLERSGAELQIFCENWSGAERSSKCFVRTGAERSGAPKFLCELERSGAELQNFCANWSGAERSSKIYVSSGAERSGAETKLTSLVGPIFENILRELLKEFVHK